MKSSTIDGKQFKSHGFLCNKGIIKSRKDREKEFNDWLLNFKQLTAISKSQEV